MSRRFDITHTEEWRTLIKLLRDDLGAHKEKVIMAAGTGNGVEKAFGTYDGYRQAIEKLESFGGEN